MLIITQRMSEPIVEWAGSSCGKHGAYTFYKGFKLTANGETRKYLLGEFYFIRNSKDRPICIAEFQLLWHDANTDNKLASARLYFRPESIPGGRQSCHGKDELLYTDEKVVIKCKDMMTLEYDGGWSYGIKAISELNLQEVPTAGNSDSDDTKKFRLLKRKSKSKKMMPKERVKMVILSFPAYCRFKSLMKKLSSGLVLTKMAIEAFGGIIQCSDGTWVSFSRESFHHPGLAKYHMFMHNKAPVLKGRPRKKKVSSTASKEEIKVKENNATVEQQPSNEAESSDDDHTDTSETSSIQELPCPPKLVSSIKEEKRSGVIQSVKQDGTPVAIPPVPKLVKIEPEKPIPYGRYKESGLMYTNQISGHQIEKNIPLKVSYSNSVIANSLYRDEGQTNRVSSTTQAREKCIRVGNICPASLPASVHASLVSHTATITTNHNIQPRMSTIMSTALATQGEVTQNLETSDRDEPRAEQPLKRKRGRPPGKSNKCLKSSEVKIAPKTAVEDDQVQIKVEDEYVYTEMECEEYSPEPQTPEESEFMKNLKIFMRKRGSPIEKIPALGFRKINLFKMYEVTQALGGYDQVTNKKLWRRVYSEVGGAPRITSAATNSRKHYEKLLLPFEKCSRGEEYLLDVKRSETPSPTPDDLASPQKDQNGNVVSQNEAAILSTSQQEKPSQPLSTIQKLQNERSIPVLSNVMQPYRQDTRVKAEVTGVMSQQDTQLKAAVTGVMSQQDIRLKTAVTGVLSQQDTRLKAAVTGVISRQNTQLKAAVTGVTGQQNTQLKAAVTGVISRQNTQLKAAVTGVISRQNTQLKAVMTGVISQKDNHLKTAVTGVTSQPNELFKSAVSRGASLCQQSMPNPASVIAQEDRHVSFVTSMKAQNKGSETITSHQDRISHPLGVHNIEHTHYTQPTSFSYQDQQDRRSMVYSKTQHQYNKAVDRDSPVEFITTGSRSSPIMFSNANKLSARYPTFDPQGLRHSARSGGFTGTGSSEHMSTLDSLRSNRKEDYPVIRTEDYSAIYARHHKTESRMSEFESKPKYLSRFDHVNDFSMPHDHHPEESHDMLKHARGTGDEILLTNVIPGKRAHSPHDVIYSLPVFQPSHYPHGGYELYDLPSTTFPVRASSRIFMPPHQVFPGPGHPAFSPYTPHIIATIGTDPSTLYQLPMPGYYPQELAYPLDTGLQILHS